MAVLSMTILRPIRTRGRDIGEAINEKLLLEIYEALVSLLTGDIRQPRAMHLCFGCCRDAREAALKVVDAIMMAYVELLADKQPSTSKLYTIQHSLRSGAGFFMVHGFGAEMIPLAIGETLEDVQLDDGDNNDANDADDFHRMCHRKARQAREAAQDEDFPVDLCVATWATEPHDKLFATLQHADADAEGNSILDLTWKDGPVFNAEKELFRRAMSSSSTMFPLEMLVHHFAADPEKDLFDIRMNCFSKAMELGAQLWAQIIRLLIEMPWLLFQLQDPRNSEEDLAAILQIIAMKPLCDWDPGLGRYIKEKTDAAEAESEGDILNEVSKGLMDAVARHGLATNFSLENLLALIRSATPSCKGRKPRASKLLCRGMVTQLLRGHLECGRPDHRGKQSRSELISSGVQIKAVRRRKRIEGTRRWHIRFANAEVR